MDNLEAAKLIVQMYGEWKLKYVHSDKMIHAVALAVGALRKECEKK